LAEALPVLRGHHPGDGTFGDANNVNTSYTPGTNDKVNGSVTLTLTTNNPAGPCNAVSDQVLITINPEAIIDAGPNQNICSDGFASLSGTIGGGASSASWSTLGDGSFGNANNLTTTYTPGSNDITNGSVTLTLTTNNPAGPCNAASDQMTINIFPAATVDAGPNQTFAPMDSLTSAEPLAEELPVLHGQPPETVHLEMLTAQARRTHQGQMIKQMEV
jgi:hypothetical protein